METISLNHDAYKHGLSVSARESATNEANGGGEQFAGILKNAGEKGESFSQSDRESQWGDRDLQEQLKTLNKVALEMKNLDDAARVRPYGGGLTQRGTSTILSGDIAPEGTVKITWTPPIWDRPTKPTTDPNPSEETTPSESGSPMTRLELALQNGGAMPFPNGGNHPAPDPAPHPQTGPHGFRNPNAGQTPPIIPETKPKPKPSQTEGSTTQTPPFNPHGVKTSSRGGGATTTQTPPTREEPVETKPNSPLPSRSGTGFKPPIIRPMPIYYVPPETE